MINIAETNPDELDKLPRMATAKLNEMMFEAFNVKEEERERARKMQKKLRAKILVALSNLKGMEKKMGFKARNINKMKNNVG